MNDSFEMPPQRNLMPLEQTGLDKEFLIGLPEPIAKIIPEQKDVF